MDGIWNFQRTISDVFSIAPGKIWRDSTITTISEARDGRKAQISEALHAILMLLCASCLIWEAMDVWKQ